MAWSNGVEADTDSRVGGGDSSVVRIQPDSLSAETRQGNQRNKQRTSRACDHCNAARRKCDGHQPCAYCVRTKSICDYKRRIKKRGKPPGTATKKQNQPLQDNSPSLTEQTSPEATPSQGQSSSHVAAPSTEYGESVSPDFTVSRSAFMTDDYHMFDIDPSWRIEDFDNGLGQDIEVPQPFSTYGIEAQRSMMAEMRSSSGYPDSQNTPPSPHDSTADNEPVVVYGIHSFPSAKDASSARVEPNHKTAQSPPLTFKISRSGTLPRATSIADKLRQRKLSHQMSSVERPIRNGSGLQYPVLRDTIHLLRPFIPDSLSFDLLEAYFRVSPATNAYLAPCAPPTVYRKHSFLRQENPRSSSQVLLVSMLWLSAQTADIPVLNVSIARRKYVRRKLLEMTTKLLRPLNEVSLDTDFLQSHNGSFATPTSDESNARLRQENGSVNALDEIMAYVHLAMVTSASEFKGASLRWWNLAFSLAREARLYQEFPDSQAESTHESDHHTPVPESPKQRPHNYPPEYTFGEPSAFPSSKVSEETREERRRVWWFLYTMDRHISLCYNKPFALLDSECQNLHRPCDDELWLSERDIVPASMSHVGQGPSYECSAPTFFGFFMPLAALLGEIVYFVQAQNHPRFGISQSTLLDWKQWEKGISDRLYAYQQSLESLLQPDETGTPRGPPCAGVELPAVHSPSGTTQSSPHETAIPIRNRVIYAYAKCIIHVLHILLAGHWDALTLLEKASWASSSAFVTAIGHVVEAASCLEMLLDVDPDAHFMPFYLGVYLLQGSLPLFVAADQLKTDAADLIIQACKTMIRVHEAHIIRMPSEYQILFVSALRLALNEMQGRTAYITESSVAKQMHVFQRYSWTREGRGLAG
ncbi:hypothetical protein BP5796_04955 [Coleophoma crateriformis]|uniref:Zn(2)-C6 fungal-type domain-containing protein n=1 Tax=Coleophoma crateriformis TaxID=565419 RepID=A0A3D8SBI4_9HELO|nr:hypothetical protein BP5796_04955 [Coleophoma crateriformis]